MELVRLGLLLLAAMWVAQIVASWAQLRYYRSVVRRTAQQWHNGFLGVGSFRPRLGAGAMAIVVIDDDARVREALSLHGLSVFARFKALAELSESSTGDFAQRVAAAKLAPGARRALHDAFEVACRTASERRNVSSPVAQSS
jgi:glucitol operon activator protein